jgi:hypothetical protein
MRLLNDMTPDERESHEADKRYCVLCQRSARRRLDRRISAVRWTGDTLFPPRRFVDARIRVIEETWSCEDCEKSRRPGEAVVGVVVDFEHVGDASEIVPRTPGTAG